MAVRCPPIFPRTPAADVRIGPDGALDGNKRLGWVSVRLFYGLNGHDLQAPRGDALAFVLAIAAGDIDDVTEAADTLRAWRT